MPLFKLNDGRYVNTEYLLDIEYTGASEGEDSCGIDPSEAILNIALRNGEELTLLGFEADTVWKSFCATQAPDREPEN
jgi:hypothetical protein